MVTLYAIQPFENWPIYCWFELSARRHNCVAYLWQCCLFLKSFHDVVYSSYQDDTLPVGHRIEYLRHFPNICRSRSLWFVSAFKRSILLLAQAIITASHTANWLNVYVKQPETTQKCLRLTPQSLMNSEEVFASRYCRPFPQIALQGALKALLSH